MNTPKKRKKDNSVVKGGAITARKSHASGNHTDRDSGAPPHGSNGATPFGPNGSKPPPSTQLPDMAAVHASLEGLIPVWNAIRPHLPTPLSEAQREEMARLTVLIAQEEASLKILGDEIATLDAKINGNQEHLTHE